MSMITLGMKKPKKRQIKRALRFDIELNVHDPKEYKTIDFPKLVQDMVSNIKLSKQSSNIVDEEDAEISEMAAYFEEKYNRSHAFKYEINKGEGYVDEDDSFIDDSEAYDEIIPPGIETQHGGFYINCGDLELVAVPEPEDKLREEREAERDRAVILQQLKRKRKASELDIEPPKVAKKVNKLKPKVKIESQKFDVTKIAKPTNDDDDDIQIIGEKPAPKDRNEESILNKNSMNSSNSTSVGNANKLQQEEVSKLITKYMTENNDSGQQEKLKKLKHSLLALKAPYEIVNQIPIIKVKQQNGLVTNEWNMFFIEFYRKSASNEPVRRKMFELLSEYTGINMETLMPYTHALSVSNIDLVRAMASSCTPKSHMPSNSSSASLLKPSVPSTKSSKVPASSSPSVTITPSNMTSVNSLVSASANNNALNLSKGQSLIQGPGFGEGLASKLQSDRSSKSSSKSSNPKTTVPNMDAFYKSMQSSGDVNQAQLDALYKKLQASDQKISAQFMNNILSNAGLSGSTTASLSRPGTSNSPSTASNSLLQPSNTKNSKTSNSSKQSAAQNQQQSAAMAQFSKIFPNYTQESLKMMMDSMKYSPITNNIINSAYNQQFQAATQARNAANLPNTTTTNLSSLSPGNLQFAAQHFQQNPKPK